MNIWQIADPVNFSIAYYYGSWTSRNFCEHCGRNGRDPILPTIVEWENENDEVGDFTHVKRSYCLLVKRNAYDAIISSLNSTGIRAETVTYHISAEARIRKEKQSLKSVSTRELIHMNIDNIFIPDYENSTLEVSHYCEFCGRKSISFTGQDIKFDTSEVKNVDFFRVDPQIPYIFCSDRAKDFIEGNRYTNVRFKKYGEVD